ncbi:MAG: polyribonucleotide nucleotidyltransferase, partial [Armatimonadota bacterium]
MLHTVEMEYAGRPLSIETGEMARQADGSATVRYGDTMALVTACITRERADWASFLPLRIDFEEKMYAVGRIPGGFFKREGRPTEEATRTMGVIDKSVRPLFPAGLRNDVQIIATALSADLENSPDIVCVIGASAALCLAGAPFAGPVAAAEVGLGSGGFILNPSYAEIEEGGMRVTVTATRDGIVAVEMEGDEVPDDVVADALQFGAQAVVPVVDLIAQLQQEAGRPPRDSYLIWEVSQEVFEAVKAAAYDDLKAIIQTPGKDEQRRAFEELTIRLREEMEERYPDHASDVHEAIDEMSRQIVQSLILQEGRRPDGRETTQVRDLDSRVGFLPRAHGSGLFTRGDTQVLTVATLGAARDQKLVRTLAEEEYKRFMHQYNFPPYSGGEVRPMRGPSRRDIRHGLLAERALERMIPDDADFPYTIRLVSEVLGSNSSSSMAAICGSTLALMDAGVPIKAPVAGVGMGLITDGNQNVILSDIQYLEDACGHMDFKVAGTPDGICALQLDMKKPGLSPDILREALTQAKTARAHILDNMLATIETPRAELSQYAPRIFAMQVDKEKIGLVIGPGGKMIRTIEADCDCTLD